jgi:DNA-binding NtrC family response regulator
MPDNDDCAMRKSILIVEDSKLVRSIMSDELTSGGLEVVGASSAEEALQRLAERPFDVVVTDLVMPGMDGLKLMEAIRRDGAAPPVVIMTAHEKSADAAVDAIRRGASDYLIKPLKDGEALFTVNRILRQHDLEEKVEYLSRAAEDRYSFSNIVGRNHAMRAIYDTIEVVAETDSTVLITGDTGTGKELVARAIHWASPRKDKRFIAINCGALPVDLLESELFGHEKGAFTGAIRTKVGKFEYADGGTIFLDEIGEIPPVIQVKILRVLQEREFERVGGNHPIKVDVRILAATNKDLLQAIQRSEFREDLYYRLNVVPLPIPPLRARREDIPLLANHFLGKCREKFRKEVSGFSQEVMSRLLLYSWPGNVRELENLVERAVIMARGGVIQSVDLPADLVAAGPETSAGLEIPSAVYDLSLAEASEIFERTYCETALARCEGRIALAAKHSGLNPRSFNRKMNKYGLDKKHYKRKKQTRMAG